MGSALSLRMPLWSGTRSNASVGRHLSGNDLPSEEHECELIVELPGDLPELEFVSECGICFEVKELLTLGCGHTFCSTCVGGQLSARWPGSRMSFCYLNCALCRVPMVHPQIETQLTVHRELQQLAEAAAVRQFRDDGCITELQGESGEPITDHEVSTRAIAEMAVFLCCDCKKPYCAGRMDCAAGTQVEDAEAKPTRCPSCEWNSLACANDHRCMVHGHRFAMFKCDSCCAVATWNCYTNHYCECCHNEAGIAKSYPCPGPEKCELGMPHPPNMEAVHCGPTSASFCIGCTACFGCTEAQQDVEFNEKNIFGFEVEAARHEEAMEVARLARERRDYMEREEAERKLELAIQRQAEENSVFWAKVDRDVVRPAVDWHTLREKRRSQDACRSLSHQAKLEAKIARWKRRPISKRRQDRPQQRGRHAGNDLQCLGNNISAAQHFSSWDAEWTSFIPGDFVC